MKAYEPRWKRPVVGARLDRFEHLRHDGGHRRRALMERVLAVTQDVDGVVAEHLVEPPLAMVGVAAVHPVPIVEIARHEEVTAHPSESRLACR
jgi:hypothetical protein